MPQARSEINLHYGEPGDPLTPRELQGLQLMAEGLTNAAIGARLGIALSTVKHHIYEIFGKLDVDSRIQAVRAGVRLGYLPPLTG